MQENPFTTTLHIAIAGLRMPKKRLRQWKKELRENGRNLWKEVIDTIRAEFVQAGIDLDGVNILMETDQDEEAQRYFTIEGIRNDEAATVRAIFEELFEVSDDNFDPTVYEDDEPEEPWHVEYDFLQNEQPDDEEP